MGFQRRVLIRSSSARSKAIRFLLLALTLFATGVIAAMTAVQLTGGSTYIHIGQRPLIQT